MIKNNQALVTEQWMEQLSDLPLASYSPASRVWIYLSSRTLNDSESKDLDKNLKQFAAQWLSHGDKMEASGEFLFNRFVLLSANADRLPPGGCSIDASVHFLRKLEEHFSIDLFNRMNVAFLNEDGEPDIFHLHSVKDLIEEGTITGQTPIFDNTVTNVRDFIEAWIKPVEKSWLKNFI